MKLGMIVMSLVSVANTHRTRNFLVFKAIVAFRIFESVESVVVIIFKKIFYLKKYFFYILKFIFNINIL
jgi:hypothetical protein